MVITDAHVVSRDPRLRPNAVVDILTDNILIGGERQEEPPLLELKFHEDKLYSQRRVDGKTTPIKIRLVNFDRLPDSSSPSGVIEVDHTGVVF